MSGTENDTTNLDRIAEQYRTGAQTDFDKAPDLSDDTPADGPLPVTGGETQPPGTETQQGTDAQELSSPDPVGYNGDAQGEHSADDEGREVGGEDSADDEKPAKKTAAKKAAVKK